MFDSSYFSKIEDNDTIIVNDTLTKFTDRIEHVARILAREVAGGGNTELAKASIIAKLKIAIKDGALCYIRHRHWERENSSPYELYIARVIKNCRLQILKEADGNTPKYYKFICPACNDKSIKNELHFDGEMLNCSLCAGKAKTLSQELSNIILQAAKGNTSVANIPQQAWTDHLRFHKIFAEHSKHGIKCPTCSRFVPNSIINNGSFICPYVDCKVVYNNSDNSNFEAMRHPSIAIPRNNISMQKMIDFGGDSVGQTSIGALMCGSGPDALAALSTREEQTNLFLLANDVINEQKRANAKTRKLPTKLAMYEAFSSALAMYPVEMLDYLTKGGQRNQTKIQSLIYQFFADSLLDKFPLSTFIKGESVYIDNPTDDRIHLFTSRRKFTTFVDHNLCISKINQFRIENGKEILDDSDHFIAHKISLTDIEGNNLMHLVDSYSFTSINLLSDGDYLRGQDVVFEYYAMKDSYNHGSMNHLQRIKKSLSLSINKRLAKNS